MSLKENGKGSTTTVQHKGELYVLTDSEAELLLNTTLECKVNQMEKKPSDISPQCSGRVDVHSPGCI